MTTIEKKQELGKYFMMKGFFAKDAQEAEIEKLAATYPAAKAAEEGLTDVVDIAYAAMLALQGEAAPTDTKQVVTNPTDTISAADKAFINTKLRAEKGLRQQKSRATKITKLLLGKPAPSDYIAAGTTGIMKVDGFKNIQEKINKGEYKLLPDDAAGTENAVASTTNYNNFVAAMANPEQHPFAVNIGKLNTRPVGYIIETLDAAGANTVTDPLTREEFEKFLILQTEGFLLAASADDPGAALRYIDPSADLSNPGKVKPGRTVVVDKNKKEAIAAGRYDIVTSVNTSKTKKATVKSELGFRVEVVGKQKNDGTPVTRLVRVSLEIDVPELETKVDYVEKFETKTDSTWTDAPNAKVANKIHEAQIKAIADLTRSVQAADASVEAWAGDIEKFIKPQAQSPAVEV